MAVLVPLSTTACAASSFEEVLIHRDAEGVQKLSFSNGKSRQISYTVNLEYPTTAVTDAQLTQLSKLGWSKCSGYREGWDSFIDASNSRGHERTVFQNLSYWSKGDSLLTIVMKYEAGVAEDKGRLSVPDNTQQYVILLENRNPGTKEWLKISCPNRDSQKIEGPE